MAALECKRLRPVVCNLANIMERARAISGARTIAAGHRALDILHVAAALEIGADLFLTFDGNQQELARQEGLEVEF